MTVRIEEHVLSSLVTNEEYARKVLPFLETSYFQDKHEQVILSEISDFFTKYNTPIKADILKVQLSSRTDLTDSGLVTALSIVDKFQKVDTNLTWLVEQTEKFCKEKSVYNAILASIKIIDGEDNKRNADAIPQLLTDALAVSFDTQVGHDFVADAESRWEFYNSAEEKLPFDLKMLNRITQGGMPRKSLFCVAAESGGGKSLLMAHVAASTLKQGKNVLYITMEMAEERIAERIDANLMRIDIAKLGEMTKDAFMTKIDKIKSKTMGRLFIKEYPTGGAHVGHFRALLEELKQKQQFTPDLLIVDYMGICASSRMKMGGAVNTYSYIKAIAEELRGLAVEFNVPCLTGAQLNRGGFSNTDVDMSNTADSIGIAQTLDFMIALIRTEELDEQGSVMIKQLKNRYASASTDKRFLVGLDLPHMTFYDLEESAQDQLLPIAKDKTFAPREKDVPLFDKSNKGKTLDVSGLQF